MLRYLNERDEVRQRLRHIPRAQVSFNYLGQFDQVVESEGIVAGGADESTGSSHGDGGTRRYLIEVSGMVTGARLKMHWAYSPLLHCAETVKQLAETYQNVLREIIEHSRSLDSQALTTSDFPLAALNEETLGRLSTLLNSLSEER
jgi:non-ribosomal peptide synthase protein (TIGR01720 family)